MIRAFLKATVLSWIILAACVLVITACGSSSQAQTDSSSDTSTLQNTKSSPARETIIMPDGYADVVTVCDNGNRVYEGDDLTVVAQDPTCGTTSTTYTTPTTTLYP